MRAETERTGTMRIIATGATSFVGRAAVKALLAHGHEVCAVVRENSAKKELLAGPDGKYPEKLSFLELDLRDVGRLPELAEGPFDVFLHMGWLGAGSDSRKDAKVQEESAECALRAVQAASALSCRRFLFTGSQAEYGRKESLTDEEAECSPTSPYGEAKLRVRYEAEKLCRELGMDYGHARIFSTYGPGDHPWSLVSTCMKAFLADDLVELTSCTQSWNFLYIDDCGEAICALAEYPGSLSAEGCVYNLSGDMEETVPLRTFVDCMQRLCGGGTSCYGFHPYNAEGPVGLYPDNRKITRVTGWKPETPFDRGIHRMLELIKADKTAHT